MKRTPGSVGMEGGAHIEKPRLARKARFSWHERGAHIGKPGSVGMEVGHTLKSQVQPGKPGPVGMEGRHTLESQSQGLVRSRHWPPPPAMFVLFTHASDQTSGLLDIALPTIRLLHLLVWLSVLLGKCQSVFMHIDMSTAHCIAGKAQLMWEKLLAPASTPHTQHSHLMVPMKVYMASMIWQKPEMMEMEGKVTTACREQQIFPMGQSALLLSFQRAVDEHCIDRQHAAACVDLQNTPVFLVRFWGV
eukprot:1136983-Pelagomonas_calceolata.AAC.1